MKIPAETFFLASFSNFSLKAIREALAQVKAGISFSLILALKLGLGTSTAHADPHQLFTAAESALTVADANLITLSPTDRFLATSAAASHDGMSALKFTAVDAGTTYAERTVVGPAVVSFWWRVSSEAGYDFLSYSVDGAQQQTISGEGAWVNQSLSLVAGIHQIRWSYTKDATDLSFDDAGYLDELVIVEAYQDLQTAVAGDVITGNSTLNFGSTPQSAAEITRSLLLTNSGTVALTVTATLPPNSGFVFANGAQIKSITINPGHQSDLEIKMLTVEGGQKTALLGLAAPESRTLPPNITLIGAIEPIAPAIACDWSGGPLANDQNTAVDLGTAPSDVTFTITNTGSAAMTISSVQISPDTNFEVASQPSSTVAANSSTSFTVRTLDANRGNHLATLTVASDASNAQNFTIPLASRTLLAVEGTGPTSGSIINRGTTAGWNLASTLQADGSTNLAIQTGATPHNGESTLSATFEGPGILSWNWKVSSQQNYDWLLCEVNGQEVAGISTKTAAWQSQVVQLPADAHVRWIYRKDAANVSGADTGHLSDIRFSKYTEPQNSFYTWRVVHGGLAPTDSISAGGIPAMFAWLGGFDPATGPTTGHLQPSVSNGLYKFRYTASKAATGMTHPQISTDLVNWNSRRLKQALLSEDATRAVIEMSIPAAGNTFIRLTAEVPAPAGFAHVEAGILPASPWASNQTPWGNAQNVAAFYIGRSEVTWSEWQTVRSWAASSGYDIGDTGAGNGPNHPVINVNWYAALKWCNARSEREGLSPVYKIGADVYRNGNYVPTVDTAANGYRLPSDKEWEFSARGGIKTKGYDFSGGNDADLVAWHIMNSGGTTHNVATKQANELGLSDMTGNVSEWCFDASWNVVSDYRALRGGAWSNGAADSLVMQRYDLPPSWSSVNLGLRLARTSVR